MRFFTDCPPAAPAALGSDSAYVIVLGDGTRIAVRDYAALLRMLEVLPPGTAWRVRTPR